jgi:hypothetical protein
MTPAARAGEAEMQVACGRARSISHQANSIFLAEIATFRNLPQRMCVAAVAVDLELKSAASELAPLGVPFKPKPPNKTVFELNKTGFQGKDTKQYKPLT